MTIPTVSVKTKTFFVEDRKRKINRREKISTWSALQLAVFRKRSTSLQLVTHVVKKTLKLVSRARRTERRQTTEINFVHMWALCLSCASASLILRRQHGIINFTVPKVLLIIISMTINWQFTFHNNSTHFCQSWRKNVIISFQTRWHRYGRHNLLRLSLESADRRLEGRRTACKSPSFLLH